MFQPRRSKRFLRFGYGLGLVLLLAPAASQAQAPVVQQQRIPELGRSVAGTDDSTALVLNPANLAFLPASELRWTGTFLREDAEVPWQGHAFALAFPLPFSLATGIRLDFVDPPNRSGLQGGLTEDANYTWLTWGLALRAGRSASFGASLQRTFADGEIGQDLSSYSLGATFRFVDELGVSFVAQDVNSPENDVGEIGASYTSALAIRPTGSREIELGLEAAFLDGADIWVPRATLGVDIPYVGRLRGEFQMSDPADSDNRTWLASAGLSVYLNRNDGSLDVSGTGFTGNAVGGVTGADVQTSLATRAFPEPVGLSFDRFSVRLRLEETPDVREHVAILRELWSLGDEPRVDAVVLELRASPTETLAHAEELRDAVLQLRRQGKRVLCHLEDADVTALYTCAAADRILINPSGGIRFAGLRARYVFFGRLLESIGVRAEVVAIGAHKSAPERFTRADSTEVSRADKIDLLQQMERQITEGLAAGRNLSFARVRAATKEGPFMAPQAQRVGFVDGSAFDDEIGTQLERLLGRSTRLTSDDRRPAAPARFATQPSIALVYVEGDMIDGRSRQVPLLDTDIVGSYTIADSLTAARESPLVKAVVLRIESPGGSSTAADVIWRQVQLTAKVKPVIVSMGGYAASGGYYIAAPGTRIFANAGTLTGSIGVFYGKPDASKLLDKLGIDVEVYKTTERADADGLYRPFTDSERIELEHNLHQFYDLFLDRVATGRKLTKSTVDRVGQGRVWTGEQALENGLVDEIGGLRQALAYARKLGGLSPEAPIVELPQFERSLLSRVLGVPGVSDHADAPSLLELLPPEARASAAMLAPFLLHSSQVPLMRLDYVLVQP
ncbi:MAG TPA: signal peptide peptidase SppA [Polyangiaceae bacterium]|nr:signal peptide peptidase SppA [Polyangiaceae bacterium]